MTLDEFFESREESRQLFEGVYEVVNAIGHSEIRITKSQIAFRRRKTFAVVWMPGKYLHGSVAPLVLTLSLSSRNTSPRWKRIVKISERRFTHHLELYSIKDIDDEVRGWLVDTWMSAG